MIHSLGAEYLVYLSSCSVTAVAVLLQCGMYFLLFSIEEPRDITTFSALLQIKHQCHQVFFSYYMSFHLTVSPLHYTLPLFCSLVLWMTLRFQEIVCETCFSSWLNALKKYRIWIPFVQCYILCYFTTQCSPVTCIDTFTVLRMALHLSEAVWDLWSLFKVRIACKYLIWKPAVSW